MILRAVGQFAEPIQFFFADDELRRGVKGLRGVLQEIIDYTRLMFSKEAASASTGQEPDIDDHLPDTMRALGNILVHLPDIDDEVSEGGPGLVEKYSWRRTAHFSHCWSRRRTQPTGAYRNGRAQVTPPLVLTGGSRPGPD